MDLMTDIQSWKTTAVGFLTGLVLAGSQLINLLDSNPETLFDLNILMAGFAALGIGVFAKDGDKSSKQLGIE